MKLFLAISLICYLFSGASPALAQFKDIRDISRTITIHKQVKTIKRKPVDQEKKIKQAENDALQKESQKIERQKQAERQARIDQYKHEQELQKQQNKQRRYEQKMDIAKTLGGILGGLFAK